MIAKGAQIDEETKAFLLSDKGLEDKISINGIDFFPKEPIASGNKGVVWRGKDEWGVDVAIKIAIAEDYLERSFIEEVIFRKRLKGYPYFAEFSQFGPIELSLPNGTKKTFVGCVEDWIEGPTLKEYLMSSDIPLSFLRGYIDQMTEALNVLKFHGLSHNDLHPGNIKISKIKKGLFNENDLEIIIIDTGSLRPISDKKYGDDHLWLVQHILAIRNTVYQRKILNIAEKKYLNHIIPLLEKMVEEDPMIALIDPIKIKKQFEAKWIECVYPRENCAPQLHDIFDYISAEFILSDKLLVELFAESCPWMNDVYGPDPIVLTGPRGCGKSTLFRRLSLKALINKTTDEIKSAPIGGFYISCSTDLKNRLNWINNDAIAKKFQGEIVHYFNMLITREICRTLRLISFREDRESLFGFSKKEELELNKFLLKKLEVSDKEIQKLQGISPIEHILEIVEMDMDKCHITMYKGGLWLRKTPISYLSDLSVFLTRTIGYFKTRKIVFFVDDLSTRQVPKAVQEYLNKILNERATCHVFKISTDKFGWERGEGEYTREFKEFDVGKNYIREVNHLKKIEFTRELLTNRLKLAGKTGHEQDPLFYLGSTKYPEGSLGKSIRAKIIDRKKINDVYFGLDTITELCAGDISNLLEVFRRIFIRAEKMPKTGTIPATDQHDAIISVSRDLREQIKRYDPYGQEMYQLTNNFGNLCKNILHDGKLRRKEDRSYDLYQTTRIEFLSIDEPRLDFTPKQVEILHELIKRGIFINLGLHFGKSGGQSELWQLRPVFCPAFEVSLTNNTSIMWKNEDIRFFLHDSKDKCEYEFEHKWKAEPKDHEIIERIIKNKPIVDENQNTPTLNSFDTGSKTIGDNE